jgi:mRNA-degrading endonuclease RelE of RelBE toxin-antitoxin system
LKRNSNSKTERKHSVLILGRNLRPFIRTVARLRKKYRSIESDLDQMFDRIAQDPESQANATPIQGWRRKIWKYRCRSSDQRKGSRGGFRVLCYFHKDHRFVIPLMVYAKSENEGQPSRESIRSLIRRLKENSSLPSDL